MNSKIKELLIYLWIALILLYNKISIVSAGLILILILYKYFNSKKKTENIYYRDINLVLNKNRPKTKFYMILCLVLLLVAVIDWSAQFFLSAEIKNNSKWVFGLYAFLGIGIFSIFNWNSPLFELWRINLIEDTIIKNYKSNFVNDLKNIDFLNAETLKKEDIYHIVKSGEYHMLNSIKYLQYSFKYLLLVLVSFLGISFYSIIWSIKMMSIVVLINYYVIYPSILQIQQDKRDIISRKLDIDKQISFIFDDYKNLIFCNKIKRKSLHQEYINKIAIEESLIERNIDKKWSFTLFKFITLTRISYYFTWFSSIIYLNNLVTITTADSIKAVLAISFSYKLSAYTNEVLLNFINYIKSTEDYLIVDRINYPNKQLARFMHIMNKNVKVNYPEIKLFNKKLTKNYIYITGESGKGKTTLLRSLFYLNPDIIPKSIYIDQDTQFNISNILCSEFIIGFETKRDLTIVKKVINIVCLNKKFDCDTIIKKPSGGELQRLRLGRAIYQSIIRNPEIFIMDEPDTGLDYLTFKQIMKNIFTNFPNSKFIFTTHKKNVIDALNIDIQIINIP